MLDTAFQIAVKLVQRGVSLFYFALICMYAHIKCYIFVRFHELIYVCVVVILALLPSAFLLLVHIPCFLLFDFIVCIWNCTSAPVRAMYDYLLVVYNIIK